MNLKSKKLILNQGLTCWFTGLSGSGKSTLAQAVYKKLSAQNLELEILDGDEVRENLCKDLGFSKEDRLKNIQRIAFLAGKISRHKVLVLVPVIAPYQSAREMAKNLSENFCEIFVKASLDTVIARDVKGLYKKALAGEIDNFTGVSDPYEEPENPDLIINTEDLDIDTASNKIIDVLLEKNCLKLVD